MITFYCYARRYVNVETHMEQYIIHNRIKCMDCVPSVGMEKMFAISRLVGGIKPDFFTGVTLC